MGKMLVFAMALALIGALAFATLSVGTNTVSPSSLKPGEEGSVSFSITNSPPAGSTSATELQNVQVFFAPSEGMEFKAKSPYVVGTLGSGGSSLVTIPFRVLPTAKGGVITATFYISEKDQPDLKTANAVIKVVNPPVLTITSDHQTIFSTDSIRLTITNNGGTASRATLSVPDGKGFALIGASQVYIGTIANSTTLELPIDASGASAGINQLPLVLSYQQEGGDDANQTKYLSLSVKKESQDLVFTQAGKVVASQDNILEISVKNNGKPLSNFRLFWIDGQLKAKENNQLNLGDLKTGGVASAKFLVLADAAPGVRDASLKMAWTDNGAEKEETLTVPIVITSDADAAIFLDAKPAPIVSGGEHTLSVLVSNIGSYKINNVEVRLADNPAFDILNAQTSQYIGGLEADDFSTVQYKVRIKNVAPGSYPLSINVKYKDASGIWVEKDNAVQINIRSATEVAGKDGGNTTLLLAVAAVAVVGGGYWYFRMRKTSRSSADSGRSR